MNTKTNTLVLTAALSILISGTALSADFAQRFVGVKPAVSGFNGKMDFGYSYIDLGSSAPANGFHGVASLSAPLTTSLGVQLDIGGAGFKAKGGGSSSSFGAGAHLFWRDPDAGLLGAYGHYMRFASGGTDINNVRLGVEAEFYLDQISVEGFAGVDVVSGAVATKNYASLDLVGAYYFNQNFRIQAGVLHTFDKTVGKIGAEAILPFASNNVALYVDGAFGSGVTKVNTGVRIYFGEAGKSLQARHREDDPKTRLADLYELTGLIAAPTATLPLTPQQQCEADGGVWNGCGCIFPANET